MTAEEIEAVKDLIRAINEIERVARDTPMLLPYEVAKAIVRASEVPGSMDWVWTRSPVNP